MGAGKPICGLHCTPFGPSSASSALLAPNSVTPLLPLPLPLGLLPLEPASTASSLRTAATSARSTSSSSSLSCESSGSVSFVRSQTSDAGRDGAGEVGTGLGLLECLRGGVVSSDATRCVSDTGLVTFALLLRFDAGLELFTGCGLAGATSASSSDPLEALAWASSDVYVSRSAGKLSSFPAAAAPLYRTAARSYARAASSAHGKVPKGECAPPCTMVAE
mmetsp:Transcript_28860/g.54511  ORF Transcript_28860/g.54511 Transcript_28860/m.54511 type:complete len:220 (-) Transcript_28860:140-799(-)